MLSVTKSPRCGCVKGSDPTLGVEEPVPTSGFRYRGTDRRGAFRWLTRRYGVDVFGVLDLVEGIDPVAIWPDHLEVKV